MYKFLLCAILLTSVFTSFSQNTPAQTAAIKSQANAMVDALVKKDYNGFVKRANPAVLAKMGGAEKMAATLKNGQQKLAANGVTLNKVTIGDPSTIITVGKEMQCIVPQTTEMKMNLGKMLAKSTLIAISTDKGKNWTFTDTGGKDLATLKTVLPTLSDKLVIPKMQQPQFVPE